MHVLFSCCLRPYFISSCQKLPREDWGSHPLPTLQCLVMSPNREFLSLPPCGVYINLDAIHTVTQLFRRLADLDILSLASPCEPRSIAFAFPSTSSSSRPYMPLWESSTIDYAPSAKLRRYANYLSHPLVLYHRHQERKRVLKIARLMAYTATDVLDN